MEDESPPPLSNIVTTVPVANVTLRQPSTTPGATVTFHNRFDILSVSTTFLSPGKPPLGASDGRGSRACSGWDNWDNEDGYGSRNNDIRQNQSTCNVRGGFGGGGGGGAPARSKSTHDIYTKSQLEASTANKESFFAQKMAENESRPDGVHLSQGGKYVGFGSSPNPTPRSNPQNHQSSRINGGYLKEVKQESPRCLMVSPFHSSSPAMPNDFSDFSTQQPMPYAQQKTQ